MNYSFLPELLEISRKSAVFELYGNTAQLPMQSYDKYLAVLPYPKRSCLQ